MKPWAGWMVLGGWWMAVMAAPANEYVTVTPRAPALVLEVSETDYHLYLRADTLEVRLHAQEGCKLVTRARLTLSTGTPETYTVRTLTDPEKEISGTLTLTRAGMDLDVDSDNNAPPPSHAPSRGAHEEELEDDPAQIGRLLVCATGDADADGVPDYADFTQAAPLVRMVLDVSEMLTVGPLESLRVRFEYSASDPARVGAAEHDHALPSAGALRIWKCDATQQRNPASVLKGGDFVPTHTDIPLARLSPLHNHTVELHLEAVKPGAQRIVATVWSTEQHRARFTDAVRLAAVCMNLIPDRNQDRRIDATDRVLAFRRPVYRYWKNNDNDSDPLASLGQESGRYLSDGDYLRTDEKGNAFDNRVNGERDLLDFFPVQLDIAGALETLKHIPVTVRLRHADNALNVLPVDFGPDGAAAHLSDPATAGKLDDARVISVGETGAELSKAFVAGIPAGRTIVLLEGRRNTTAPLIVEIVRTKGDVVIAQQHLPLQIASTMDMMRWINLQLPDGRMRDDMREDRGPPNWPDAETNGRHVVFVHGFNEDDQSAPGHASAIFKRLFWAGSRAALTAVRWSSNLAVDTTDIMSYQHDVTNAIPTGRALASKLRETNGWRSTTLLAHSLGTLVGAECVAYLPQGHVDQYIMLNAAVASEAFLPESAAPREDDPAVVDHMVHVDWMPYARKLRMAEWYRLFPAGDARTELTWRGRYADVPSRTQLWNFYSSSENVLEVGPATEWIFSVAARNLGYYFFAEVEKGRLSWQAQELWKGKWRRLVPVTADFGGWRFTDFPGYREPAPSWEVWRRTRFWRPERANQLTDEELRLNPFFRPEGDHAPPGIHALYTGLEGNGPQQARAFLNDSHLVAMLGRVIPATSRPAGSGLIPLKNETLRGRQVNLHEYVPSHEDVIWPRDGRRWWHRDHRRVAFQYVSSVYERIVDVAQLKETTP